jgi:flagellar biosynthesis GTPase FlhF
MELSKEVYPKSPEKKDIQSVVNDLLQDEKIVGKKKKNEKNEKKEKKENPEEKKEKKENPEEKKEKKENPEEKKEEKPIEKKRRGRPPKKNIQIEDKSESKLDVDVDVIPKKPRGRPRKIKLPSTPHHDTTHNDPDPTHNDPDPTHILPLIQSISSTHLLHTLPDKTLKYIIFLIHLSYHTPITQNTLHTLIHTSIHSFKHFSPLRTTFIKHQLLSASSAPSEPSEPSDTSP